jgi:CMP-2-keto-3-deoxyoctulosonic acid synthetase
MAKGDHEVMVVTVKGDNPTKEQQQVIDEVAKWIDTNNIAEIIAEELVDSGQEVTVENMQKVWLSVLDSLWNEVRSVIAGW